MAFLDTQPIYAARRIYTGTGSVTFGNESILIVKKAVGEATTVNLNKMTGVGYTTNVIVIDGKGDSATNNITIVPNGSETINGGANFVLASNYGAVNLFWSGSEWLVTKGTANSGANSTVTNMNVTGNLTVSGTANVTGATNFVGDMTAGNVTLGANKTLTVTTTANLAGTLSVTGNASFGANSTVNIAQNALVGGTVNVTGSTNLATAGFLAPSVARTSTNDGLTTGIIAAAGCFQFVTVTSASSANLITLPTPTPGTFVLIAVGANGYKLRTSTPASIALNGGTGASASSSIAASSWTLVCCTSATTWQAINITGTTLTAVAAAA